MQPDFTRLDLARLYIQASEATDVFELESLRTSAEITAHFDRMRRNLVMTITAQLPALLKERITINRRWPKDWWEALKERFAPEWFIARYPVIYEEIFIDEPLYAAVCPHLPVHPTGKHLQWMVEKQEELGVLH